MVRECDRLKIPILQCYDAISRGPIEIVQKESSSGGSDDDGSEEKEMATV